MVQRSCVQFQVLSQKLGDPNVPCLSSDLFIGSSRDLQVLNRFDFNQFRIKKKWKKLSHHVNHHNYPPKKKTLDSAPVFFFHFRRRCHAVLPAGARPGGQEQPGRPPGSQRLFLVQTHDKLITNKHLDVGCQKTVDVKSKKHVCHQIPKENNFPQNPLSTRSRSRLVEDHRVDLTSLPQLLPRGPPSAKIWWSKKCVNPPKLDEKRTNPMISACTINIQTISDLYTNYVSTCQHTTRIDTVRIDKV